MIGRNIVEGAPAEGAPSAFRATVEDGPSPFGDLVDEQRRRDARMGDRRRRAGHGVTSLR